MIRTLLNELNELNAMLGEGCFMKPAATDDALFVTDAPRRLSPQALQTASDALAAAGYLYTVQANGLWAVDPDENRWQAMLTGNQRTLPCAFPSENRLMDVYALARLLAAHPAPWREQPRAPIRALLKRMNRPPELLRYAPVLLAQCAESLRRHRALPSAAAGMLFDWLSQSGKESKS